MNAHTSTHFRRPRRGNLLVGCLTVLGVVVIVLIVSTIFVVRSWRGWVAGWTETAVDAALVEMQIDDAEHAEIMAHVTKLMGRYENKDLTMSDLGQVLESLVESPLAGTVLIGGIKAMYIDDSGLSDEEKGDGQTQLARYAQGMRDELIDPDSIEEVLASVSTTTPDGDDIQLSYGQGPTGTTQYALRSSDEVSDDDLRAMFEAARLKADEAGIDAEPEEVDLSDTLGVAIAQALGEDPAEWVPGWNEGSEIEVEVETQPVENDGP